MSSAYDPSAYNRLPLLPDAGKMFDVKHGDGLLEEFRLLFQQYKTDRTFGLVLNHRHFDISPNERLVEYQGTLVPWQNMVANTKPSSWFVSEDDECLPYEFYYSPRDDKDDSPNQPEYSDFVKSFNQLLRQKDAFGLFGLCRYPGDDFEGRVEITEGRANINLHPNDVRLTQTALDLILALTHYQAPTYLASRPAAWFFSPNLLGKCVCICGGDGHTKANHRGHVPAR